MDLPEHKDEAYEHAEPPSRTIVHRDVHVYTHTHTHTHYLGTSLTPVQTKACLILPHTPLTYQQNTQKDYPVFRLKYVPILGVSFHHTEWGN